MLSRYKLRRLRAESTDDEPNRLRRALKLARITQEQIEAVTGISQATISRAVNGIGDLTPEIRAKLASHLGCSVEDLFPPKDVAA